MATDPSRLSLTPEGIAELAPRQHAVGKSSKRSNFTIFPDVWRDQLERVKADGSTYRVAIHLLREAWRTGNNRVKLPNVTLAQRNVTRWNKQHALNQLVKAGLITTERPPRKSPVAVLKFTD